MSTRKDRIYSEQHESIGRFTFDARVAAVFEDMISRSVPGYRQILELLPTLVKSLNARQTTNPKSNDTETQNLQRYYDLGCSLGAGMLAIAQGVGSVPAQIIGIDNSADMLAQAKENLNTANLSDIVSEQSHELHCQDILGVQFERSNLVLMNFTLQFIEPAERSGLIANIYASLVTGGALVLSEKLKFANELTGQTLIDIHHQYKADQGYSQMEIAQKRDAIDNVLIPETIEVHTERLRNAGFSVVTPWIQNLQFVSILAIK